MAEQARSAQQRWDDAHQRHLDLDQKIHAVITWVAGSRADSVRSDERIAAGLPARPLEGLLVGVKDNIDTAGVPTTSGAAFLRDHVPDRDATVIRRLHEAGAVVVAKLNMAELAWGATTQNATYGACRNPWALDRIPGGSSGGSGAALAARYCDLALGTDTGASVRIPAAVNGVVGLRPSVGLISNHGIFPVSRTQDTVGPMAHTAADTARLTDALSGYDPLDPQSRRDVGAPACERLGVPVTGLRIGVPQTHFYDDLEPGVALRAEEFLSSLTAMGCVLVPIPDFGQGEAFEHWTRIVQCEGAQVHRERLERSPEDFSPDVRARISAGLDVPATELARSLTWRAGYRRALETVLGEVDVVVAPVVPIDVPSAEGYDSREQTALLGRLTYAWALHAGPTLSLPIGFHPDSGLPVGMALVAGHRREAVLFQLADAYQQLTDWHRRSPVAIP